MRIPTVSPRARSTLLADVRTGGSDARLRVFAELERRKVGADAPMLDDAQRSLSTSESGDGSDVDVGGCPCLASANSIAVMRDLGMSHAAKMHAMGDEYDLTPEDWRQHAKEEDDILFPKLLIIADKWLTDGGQEQRDLIADVELLIREHRQSVYPVVARGELPDAALMVTHGELENRLLEKYGNRLRKLVGIRVKNDANANVMARVAGSSLTAQEIADFTNDARAAIETAGNMYNDARKKYEEITGKSGASKSEVQSAMADELRAAANSGRQAQKDAEKNADGQFLYVTGKASAAVGSSVVLLPFVPIVAVMGAAAFALFKAGTVFFKWAFGVGRGFSEEWANYAAEFYSARAAEGLPVMAFNAPSHTSPKAYVEELEVGQAMLYLLLFDNLLLSNVGSDPKGAPARAGASINRQGKTDPIIMDNLIAIQKPGERNWVRNNSKTTDVDGDGLAGNAHEANIARRIVEIVAISAAKDAGLPLATYKRLIEAGNSGWNRGIVMASKMQVCAGLMFNTSEGCDRMIMKDGSAEALALSRIAVEQEIEKVAAELVDLGVATADTAHKREVKAKATGQKVAAELVDLGVATADTAHKREVKAKATGQTGALLVGGAAAGSGVVLGLMGLVPVWGAVALASVGVLLLASTSNGTGDRPVSPTMPRMTMRRPTSGGGPVSSNTDAVLGSKLGLTA